MIITATITEVGTANKFNISTSEVALRGEPGPQGPAGVIPQVTLAALTTTHLAANNFPAMAYCTDTSIQDYVKSTGTQWKKFDGTVVSTDPGAVLPPTGIVRFSSPLNRFLEYPLSPNAAYVMSNCSRYEQRIGSGDQIELGARANNNFLWLGDVENPGNTLTIVNMFMEVPGKTSQRITFGGAHGTTLTDGAFDVASDPILPAAFGLTVFPIGMQYFIRSEVTIPAGGRLCSIDTWDTNNIAGHVFDGSSIQCTNIAGSGDLTYTGNVLYASQSWTPIMVGKFSLGDPKVVLGAGDSVLSGVGDSSDGMGNGFFGRALCGSSWATSIAGCNASRSSGNAQAWQSSPALSALAKYANMLVEEYGTNSFDNTGNIASSGVQYTVGLSRFIWTTCKSGASQATGAAPFKVVRTKLFPRTGLPAGPLVTDQTVYGPKWDVSGNVDEFNTSVAADAAVDAFVSFDTLARASQTLGNASYYKWLNGINSTADGTHPAKSIHIAAAALLRAQLV